jgi:hypothetical protein
MSILDNLESYLEYADKQSENLQTKIFSETVCINCSEKESTHMPNTDNMGRDKFWEDLYPLINN